MCIFMRARRLTQPWKCYLGPPGASWTGTPFWRGWLLARQCATAPRSGWRNLGKPSGSSKRSMTMSAVGRSCCRASTMMRWCKSASCLSTLRRHSKATTGASTSAFAVTTPSWTSGALSSWLRSMSRGGTKLESRTKPMVQSGRLPTKSYSAWFTSTTMHMLRIPGSRMVLPPLRWPPPARLQRSSLLQGRGLRRVLLRPDGKRCDRSVKWCSDATRTNACGRKAHSR